MFGASAKAQPCSISSDQALYAWDSMHFDKGLARAEKIYLEELMTTADAQRGIGAFMEKREPQWRGSKHSGCRPATVETGTVVSFLRPSWRDPNDSHDHRLPHPHSSRWRCTSRRRWSS